MEGARSVSSDEIAAYDCMIESVVRPFAGERAGEHGRFVVELDDLIQEGRLKVFRALRQGARPSKRIVEFAAMKWVKKCSRHGFASDDAEEDDE